MGVQCGENTTLDGYTVVEVAPYRGNFLKTLQSLGYLLAQVTAKRKQIVFIGLLNTLMVRGGV